MNDKYFVPVEEEEVQETEPSSEELRLEQFNEGLAIETEPAGDAEKSILPEWLSEDEFKTAVKKYSEIDDRVRQTRDAAFGRIGSIEQALESLKTKNGEVTLSTEHFTKLSEYLGDDEMTTALIEGLNEALKTGVRVHHTNDDEKLNAVKKELRLEFENRLVEIQHPDWVDIVSSEEFDLWKSKLPKEQVDELLRSEKASEVITVINQFKNWKEKTDEVKQKKQELIDRAMPIKTSGSGSSKNKDATSAFLQGLYGT